MTKQIDYTRDFKAFFRDLFVVEGAYGPNPLVPEFLGEWLQIAFPLPAGDPKARNIGDFRSKKEGKSALAGAVALYMASRKEYSEVVITASDIDQAKDRVLRAVKYAVDCGPLASHARVFKNTIELDNHSIIQAISSDWQGAAGGNYSCVIFDELHSWIYESQRRLFDEMVIPPTQPNGVRWIASYAGWEGESLLLKEWWDRALAGEIISENLPIYYNPGASMLAFVDVGESSWRMPWMIPEYIAETRQSERPNTFRRIWLNEWVTGDSQFLPAGTWEACYSPEVKPLQPGENIRLVLGADASTSRDFTALVGVAYNSDSNTSDVRLVKVWKPKKGFLRMGKPTIDLDETIGRQVLKLHEAGQVEAVICDPYQLHSLIIEWEKAGINVIELPQSSGRVEADQALYDSVIGRSIRHFNEPELNEHIRNAVAIETNRGMRLAKEKTSQKIDAAVALSMALHGSLSEQKASGSITVMPNIFYTNLPEGLTYFLGPWGYVMVDRESPEYHKPGVTWKNCKYESIGCRACVKELYESGEYDRLQLVDKARMAMRHEIDFPKYHVLGDNHDNELLSKFWKSVRNHLAR